MAQKRMSANEVGKGRFKAVRLLIFDLDGTLIDSRLDLVHSVNATLERLGRAPLPHETIEGYVGNGVSVLIHRCLGPGATEEEVDRGQKFFLAYYREHMLDNTVIYPGVLEALDALRGRDMAVLTNKPVRFSEDILKGLGIAPYFRFIYGGNSFACKKPDPVGVNTLLRGFAASPDQAMMVGDSAVDVRTARNAGIWSCGVTYGLGLESMRAEPPDLMLDNLAQLPSHLNGHGA
ncbi:MAG TPA: HAD-IA family hydrolase [Candidatus Aquilonibacter sp.]|nr:HAD-IA family hydrolase [Candidatus Aquilonibacter sp.]